MALHDPPDWNWNSLDRKKVDKVSRLIGEFFKANTWSESQRLVERNPELLSQEAFYVLDTHKMFAQRNEPELLGVIEEHRSVLKRCLEIGIAAAFREKITGQR